MAAQQGWKENIVVIGALLANIGIAIAKFIAAAITGSASMLSEGFHSTVDSTNELLLLYGKHRASRKPDRSHPFGYGRELYFWGFVVAILIFGLGSALSAYEGYTHLVSPEELTDPLPNYIVLGIALLFEGISWSIGVHDLGKEKGGRSWWATIRRSKNPSTIAVVFEDSAALLGLIVAGAGVYLSHAVSDPRIDGIASLVIAGILAVVAMLLARETKSLLIGEPADPGQVELIRSTIEGWPGIDSVHHVRTIYSAPDRLFAAVSADFRDDLSMGDGERIVDAIEARLRESIPELGLIYIRPAGVEALGDAAAPGRPSSRRK